MKICQYSKLLALGTWFFIATCAGGTCRVFTDVNGRSVKGQLLEFNADQQMVFIQRINQKVCQAPLSSFSKADQQYILEQGLLNTVKISAKMIDLGKTKTFCHKQYKPEDVKCLGYAVMLKNSSVVRLEDVDIAYCIFYRQERFVKGKTVLEEGRQCGGFDVAVVEAGSNHNLKTDSIFLYDEQIDTSLFGSTGGAEGRIQGIWIRATATLPSGNKITREFCNPCTIDQSKDWATTTVLAGLNAEMKKKKYVLPKLPPRKHHGRKYEWGGNAASR